MTTFTNSVTALKDFCYIPSEYHSDGHGHLQVQITAENQPQLLDKLLLAIETNNEWDNCFLMLKKQPEPWLLDVSECLQNTAHYHTKYQLKVYDILHNTDNVMSLLESAQNWYWDSTNWKVLSVLIDKITNLLDNIEPKASQRESIINSYGFEEGADADTEASNIDKYIKISFLESTQARLKQEYLKMSQLYAE